MNYLSSNHELLGALEERNLLSQAITGDITARDRLIECNQRLVWKIARKYFNSARGGKFELEDLVQVGNLGLLRAVEKWDLNYSNRFSTYATDWVEARIRRAIAGDQTILTTSEAESVKLLKIRKTQNSAGSFCPAEISKATGIDTAFIAKAQTTILGGEVRLDKEIGDDEQGSIYDLIPDPQYDQDTIEDQIDKMFVIQKLSEAVNSLPEIEKKVITLAFLGDRPRSPLSIARELKLRQKYTYKVYNRALRRLRTKIRWVTLRRFYETAD